MLLDENNNELGILAQPSNGWNLGDVFDEQIEHMDEAAQAEQPREVRRMIIANMAWCCLTLSATTAKKASPSPKWGVTMSARETPVDWRVDIQTHVKKVEMKSLQIQIVITECDLLSLWVSTVNVRFPRRFFSAASVTS